MKLRIYAEDDHSKTENVFTVTVNVRMIQILNSGKDP